jgi:hypothetical protein
VSVCGFADPGWYQNRVEKTKKHAKTVNTFLNDFIE